MLTRHANDWTARFRLIAALPAELPAKTAYLDGEIAVPTSEGISDFAALQEALGRHGGSKELAYILFDILHLNGENLRPLPLIEPKAILAKLLAKLPVRSAVQFSGHVTGQGREFFALACKRHPEGVVFQRAAPPCLWPRF
jgi:bifunctional non-homologous end joining protein LigD